MCRAPRLPGLSPAACTHASQGACHFLSGLPHLLAPVRPTPGSSDFPACVGPRELHPPVLLHWGPKSGPPYRLRHTNASSNSIEKQLGALGRHRWGL